MVMRGGRPGLDMICETHAMVLAKMFLCNNGGGAYRSHCMDVRDAN
jgi:hypothetical protein